MTDTATIKIFAVTESEWWMGTDLDSVVKAAQEEYGLGDDDVADAVELVDSDLDSLNFCDSDEDGRPTGHKRTFREQLVIEVAAGGSFPRLFAMEDF
ncbi:MULTISPECIES: hypothetical protein [Stenotrophomonas]|uniref:hypothetical protein n=1 Tax=Stenotrophomonas TaxID=40323 RepID=UPI000DAA3AF8|nr:MULTISPECIES: hypothetical protein [Stenotrophomonas]AYA90395.1 hypothetical protein PEM_06420 [Stenotrophomonas sp. Pemsol]MCU1004521.1 hypothetical protein [Stenotrophomonas maltophilia]